MSGIGARPASSGSAVITVDGREARPAHVASPWLVPLRLPLLGKLAGLNVLVAGVASAALLAMDGNGTDDDLLREVALLAIVLGVAVSVALTRLALQPVARLRATLRRFARGDADARIRPSLVADRDLLGVGDAVNDLLEDLVAERSRVQQLARDTIRGADEERARIARGLHDSTAQTLAALSIEARMALELEAGHALSQQLVLIRDLAIDALDEVRDLSHTIHPRVLDDLGLEAALGWLARGMRERCVVTITLQTAGDDSHVPSDVASALFRIAEAALDGTCGEGGARSVALELSVTPERVLLEVRDDGRVTQWLADKLGALGERLALSGGRLTMNEIGGRGVDVHAVVPLGHGPRKE
jgi:signal transduction histidine kinase